MMYYIVYIFEMAGLTGNQNLLAASIQYIIVSAHYHAAKERLVNFLSVLERGDDITCYLIPG